MSKLKQKYPTKKKAQLVSRDDGSMEIDEQTDGDIIRCVCDDSDDDGFTIQYKKSKSKKLLKRTIPKKRVYPQDSEDEESTAHHIPPTISKSKFTPLSKNVFKEKLVEHLLIEVHRQWMESNKSKSSTGKSKVESPSTSSAAAKGLESIVVMESNLLLPAIPKASASLLTYTSLSIGI
ncbi:hypothetical protein G6F42_019388 [Rhizopus arrhizus]|nr:hypothetical protein G6F42_019388 [Rhizopus arrhizus]